jgi:hypothetical protein
MGRRMLLDPKCKVRHNGLDVSAEIVYYSSGDEAFLQQWRIAADGNRLPGPRDALEFAECAHLRYKKFIKRDNYAQSTQQILDYTRDNPRGEVANYMMLKCDWFGETSIIGTTHFRRTWCNSIVIDYLTVYPKIADRSVDIRGAGTAILAYLARLAYLLNANKIWGEATQNSCDFYRKAFELKEVDDLILVTRAKLRGFMNDW